jgi:hypothetical protein
MEQSFSQRMGFTSVKKVFQVDSMDEDLRTALWNDFYNYLWTKFPGTTAYSVYSYMTDIWTSYFRKAVDQVPDLAVFLYHVRKYFFECGLFSLPVLIGAGIRPFLQSGKAEKITLGCEGGVIVLASLNNTTEKNVCATRTSWASHPL